MLGNVWEWTCSAFKSDYGGEEKSCAAKNHADERVLRGGSWKYAYPELVRSAIRVGDAPGYRNDDVGFRVAQDR